MRRPIDAAEPARHVLLGLMLDGPRHGYDLARAFEVGTPLGAVVHLGSSHLYALLVRLEHDGLVASARQEQAARPARRVYRLTEAGRDEVQRWVDQPVARPRDVLLDFPLKLYLAWRLDIARAQQLVSRQRALFLEYLAGLEREAEQPRDGAAGDAAFLELLRDGRIYRVQATLSWLERCGAALEALAAVPGGGRGAR